MFSLLVTVSSQDFRECDSFVLPVFLACSAGMLTGNVYCHMLGFWDKLEERRLEKNIFLVHWKWVQRGKGEHSSFPGTELTWVLGDQISGAIGDIWV